ncbi:hypothetical protein AAMO2058_001026800 [Amorphochlora amoebiformis]
MCVGTFKKRTEDDIKQRQRKTEQREKDALKSFTFKPEITKSPKGVKVKGKFLSRVKEDINARQNRETSEKPNPECKFKPEISKNTQKIMRAKGMPKFMSRMTEDLEARRDKQEEIKKALMKPPKLYKKARPRKKALKKDRKSNHSPGMLFSFRLGLARTGMRGSMIRLPQKHFSTHIEPNRTDFFRKSSGENIEDITSYVRSWVNNNPGGEVHIGADSRSIDRIVVFAVAICLYRQSSGGHVVYKKMKVPFNGSRKNLVQCRLFEECEQALEVAGMLEKEAPPGAITVHIDCNPDVRYLSSSVYKATYGWIKSAGYKAKGKPDAWAASSVANHIVNGQFGHPANQRGFGDHLVGRNLSRART